MFFLYIHHSGERYFYLIQLHYIFFPSCIMASVDTWHEMLQRVQRMLSAEMTMTMTFWSMSHQVMSMDTIFNLLATKNNFEIQIFC